MSVRANQQKKTRDSNGLSLRRVLGLKEDCSDEELRLALELVEARRATEAAAADLKAAQLLSQLAELKLNIFRNTK